LSGSAGLPGLLLVFPGGLLQSQPVMDAVGGRLMLRSAQHETSANRVHHWLLRLPAYFALFLRERETCTNGI